MKKILGLIVLVLLLGAGCSQKPVIVSKDISVRDISAFFNSHQDPYFDCTKIIKSHPQSRACFTQDFKSLYRDNVFDNPTLELIDFTGDGNLDAYVTINRNGTGYYKDFYALTKGADGSVLEVYKKAGYGRSRRPEVTVFSYSREKGTDKKFLGWTKEKNTFEPIEFFPGTEMIASSTLVSLSRDIKNCWDKSCWKRVTLGVFHNKISFSYPTAWGEIQVVSDASASQASLGSATKQDGSGILIYVTEKEPRICLWTEEECANAELDAPTKMIDSKEFFGLEVEKAKKDKTFVEFKNVDGIKGLVTKENADGQARFVIILPVGDKIVRIAETTQDEKLFKDFLSTVSFDKISNTSKVVNYLVSTDNSINFCNGGDMDSVGYRKTLTKIEKAVVPKNLSQIDLLREVLKLSTGGSCHQWYNEMKIKGGTLIFSMSGGLWAGSSINLCHCMPEIEVNASRFFGIKNFEWGKGKP